VLGGVFVVILATLLFTALNPASTSAASGIESQLSFEGKIVNSSGTNIADGSYNMEFKIYTGCTNNTGSGCTLAWTEDYLKTSHLILPTLGPKPQQLVTERS
jgi:hypothetical protein